jgi:hypothetical protein
MVSVSEILNPVSQLFITAAANIPATDFDTGSQNGPFAIILQSSAQLQLKKRATRAGGEARDRLGLFTQLLSRIGDAVTPLISQLALSGRKGGLGKEP